MTAVLVALTLTGAAAFRVGWWARGERDETRALDAHLAQLKADVYRESGERLYDEYQDYAERVNPELTRLQGLYLRYRALAQRRESTT